MSQDVRITPPVNGRHDKCYEESRHPAHFYFNSLYREECYCKGVKLSTGWTITFIGLLLLGGMVAVAMWHDIYFATEIYNSYCSGGHQ